jgi:hypothetical protein
MSELMALQAIAAVVIWRRRERKETNKINK